MPRFKWPKIIHTPFRKWNLAKQGAEDPNEFVGRAIYASKELGGPLELVTVQDVRGCLGMGEMSEEQRSQLIKSFQINGTHLVPIYSFYTQLHEGRLPTPEEASEFELATQITDIREIKGK